jgi:hypothetical protein
MTEQPATAPFEYGERLIDEQLLAAWALSPPGQVPTSASGPCPRCGHQTDMPITTKITTGTMLAVAEPQDPARTLTVQIVCACTGAHAGRSDADTQGCGAWWLADLAKNADGSYSLSPTVDRTWAQAAIEVRAAAETQNADVHNAAEKWLGGIAALYGLFSLAGVITGRDAVAALSTAGKVAVGILAFAAILTAGWAVVNGYKAAYGWPIDMPVTCNKELAAWKEKREKFAPAAGRKLRTAVRFAAASLCLIVVTVGVIWFGPRATENPRLEIATTDGGTACGTLVSWSPEDGRIQLKDPGGRVFTMEAGTIAKITVTESCGDTNR